METLENKYSKVDEDLVESYLDGLVAKIFKMLPMKEEDNSTLPVYHESLMYELTGFSKVFLKVSKSQDFVSLVSSIESLRAIEDLSKYKRKVFECINLAKKIAR